MTVKKIKSKRRKRKRKPTLLAMNADAWMANPDGFDADGVDADDCKENQSKRKKEKEKTYCRQILDADGDEHGGVVARLMTQRVCKMNLDLEILCEFVQPQSLTNQLVIYYQTLAS